MKEFWNNFDSKLAYPNNDQYVNIPGQHDLQKWVQAVKNIYYKHKNGLDKVKAIQEVTSNWNVMETTDFLNWLKFYEGGNHLKYKKAQLWYVNDSQPGYFLNIKPDKDTTEKSISGNDIEAAKDSALNELSSSEQKKIIEKQRNKIIGRLDSAEKLLRTEDGHLFAGKEFEVLLETLYSLKKKIQMVNKISSSTRLYEDMIVREANILNKKGFIKASDILHSVANETDEKGLTPAITDPPTKGNAGVGGLPYSAPGSPQNPPEAQTETQPTIEDILSPGMQGFMDKLNSGGINTNDTNKSNDLEVFDAEDDIIIEAQTLPQKSVNNTLEDAEDPLEVNEEDIKPEDIKPEDIKPEDIKPKSETENRSEESKSKDIDSIINSALSNLTINDVIYKLEDISKIFKTREIPRQLALIDMLMNRLGIAYFFPSLSEVLNKALESNNYISTRLDDILSKLSGAMETKDIDLKNSDQLSSPELDQLKNTLRMQEDKDKQKKQLRKKLEDKVLEENTKETPEIEVNEDLEVPIEKAETIPVKQPTPQVKSVP